MQAKAQMMAQCKALFSKIGFPDNTIYRIGDSSIQLGMAKEDNPEAFYFASEITIYLRSDEWPLVIDTAKGIEINYGTSGSFDLSNTASCFRTIQAARILNKWEAVTKATKKSISLYKALQKKCSEANKTK